MKVLFSTIFLVFTAAQSAGASESGCTRSIFKSELSGQISKSVYCQDTAQSGTRCESVITGRDAWGDNRYIVSCADNGGPWYNVSEDGLTRDQAELLLDKIDAQLQSSR
jgi:hypothetical protein